MDKIKFTANVMIVIGASAIAYVAGRSAGNAIANMLESVIDYAKK